MRLKTMLQLDITDWVRLHSRLTTAAMASLQIVLLGIALSRGLDYALPPAPSTAAITYVESFIPIWIWGIGMCGAAAIGLVGMRWVCCPVALTACGHAVLGGLYFGFGASAVFTSFDAWPPQDWRTGVAWLGAACVHWILANASWGAWRDKSERFS